MEEGNVVVTGEKREDVKAQLIWHKDNHVVQLHRVSNFIIYIKLTSLNANAKCSVISCQLTQWVFFDNADTSFERFSVLQASVSSQGLFVQYRTRLKFE